MITTQADRALDCGVQVWTREGWHQHNPRPRLTAFELMATSFPPLTFAEMRLVVETVQRVSPRRALVGVDCARPIDDSGLPERRRIRLMTIAIARMNDLGIKRWESERDYSSRTQSSEA